MNNVNRCISCNEIEAVIRRFPTPKSPGANDFSEEFDQNFKGELTTILFKLFHTIEKAIPLWVYIQRMLNYMTKTPMFIAALFVISRNWK